MLSNNLAFLSVCALAPHSRPLLQTPHEHRAGPLCYAFGHVVIPLSSLNDLSKQTAEVPLFYTKYR